MSKHSPVNRKAPVWSMYKRRDEILRKNGYRNYKQYLKSKFWRNLRDSVMDRHGGNCQFPGCKRKSRTAHHVSYHFENLISGSVEDLIPVCEPCHTRLEFKKKGRKRNPAESALMLPGYRQCPGCHRSRNSRGWCTKYDVCAYCAGRQEEHRKKPNGHPRFVEENPNYTHETPTLEGWYWRAQALNQINPDDWEMIWVRERDGTLQMCDPTELVYVGSYGGADQHDWEPVDNKHRGYSFVWNGPLKTP